MLTQTAEHSRLGQEPISSHARPHDTAVPVEGSTAGVQTPQYMDFYLFLTEKTPLNHCQGHAGRNRPKKLQKLTFCKA